MGGALRGVWDGRSIKSRGLGLLCMRDQRHIYFWLVQGVPGMLLFCGLAWKMAKAYRDGGQAVLG